MKKVAILVSLICTLYACSKEDDSMEYRYKDMEEPFHMPDSIKIKTADSIYIKISQP